jgi:4-hydroxy-tetrahydrodipicolinate synthase
MTETDAIRGVVAAIATPVTKEGEPDHGRLLSLAKFLLAEGCDGLNVLGTTGEATSFTTEQRMGAMTAMAKSGLPLRRMMVGTGAAAVGDAVRLSVHAAQLGFTGVLLLPPFYYKGVSNAGVGAYIGAVAAATAGSKLPLYLYNFPALSGIAYTPALVAELVQQFGSRIAGLKDSSGNIPYAREVAAISSHLHVFPSNEGTLMDARAGGPFAGCISATANLNAALCAKAYRTGDQAALGQAVTIREMFGAIALIPGIKLMLAHIHKDPALAAVMPPLMALSEIDANTLRERYTALTAQKELAKA